ncbi:MAG: EamA family transporter [Actinobacteria bacterium]|nr:EamA family transporter [Actinomycetota bacterium]MSW24234.1 EamA family transporter [Actinomycetota bacterium]MSX29100.1 EamA family transporter [Actinomycetota bacterium]MSX43003.1 EamA family transporter [Actinomycetota bacterium]MSX97268.1 EamA family transporter [Actinomycetota bacterium]
MNTSPAPTKSWLALWLVLTTIWGFSFFFIKVASSFLDPYEQTFARMGFGALALILIVLVTRRKFIVRGPAVKHLALITVMAQVLPFATFAWAIHHISSIAAGLLNSTMPLWTAVLAVLMLPEEKLTTFRVGGLILGFLGLLVLLGVWDVNFQANWLAYTACAFCTIGYAFSAIWTRKYLTPMGLDSISAVATQLTIGAAICAVFAIASPHEITSWPITGILAIVALGVLGTGAALVIGFVIVKRAGAIAMSTVTYSIPVVSTLAGVLLLNEKMNWYEPIGALIVLIGIAIVQELIKPRVVALP